MRRLNFRSDYTIRLTSDLFTINFIEHGITSIKLKDWYS